MTISIYTSSLPRQAINFRILLVTVLAVSIILICSSSAKASFGGYYPSDSEWPWLVSVQKQGDPSCGGTLVSPTRVVTAAHCVVNADGSTSSPSLFQAVIGRWQLSATNVGQSVGVANILVHPKYHSLSDGAVLYDVAVLVLATHVHAYAPAQLGTESDFSSDFGPAATAMGWGHTSHNNGGISSNRRVAVDLPLWNDSDCQAVYGSSFLPAVNFCAGGDGVVGTCHGDSGGPVMVRNGTWRLIGVVSWGPPECAVAGEPSVYAWVAGKELRAWVTAAMVEAPAPPAPTCKVPNLKKKTKSAAKRSLARAGCKLGKTKTKKLRKPTKRKRNRVRSQSVRPGSTVPAGTAVNLTINK